MAGQPNQTDRSHWRGFEHAQTLDETKERLGGNVYE